MIIERQEQTATSSSQSPQSSTTPVVTTSVAKSPCSLSSSSSSSSSSSTSSSSSSSSSPSQQHQLSHPHIKAATPPLINANQEFSSPTSVAEPPYDSRRSTPLSPASGSNAPGGPAEEPNYRQPQLPSTLSSSKQRLSPKARITDDENDTKTELSLKSGGEVVPLQPPPLPSLPNSTSITPTSIGTFATSDVLVLASVMKTENSPISTPPALTASAGALTPSSVTSGGIGGSSICSTTAASPIQIKQEASPVSGSGNGAPATPLTVPQSPNNGNKEPSSSSVTTPPRCGVGGSIGGTNLKLDNGIVEKDSSPDDSK